MLCVALAVCESGFFAYADSLHADKFPSLLITEICSDTFGFENNENVINKSLIGKGGDTYEFIEIYNNSDTPVNIYDYCLLYNNKDVANSSFEKLVMEMTPFESGKNWIDGWDASKFWTGKTKMPENPAYENGYVQPGQCVVIWVLYFESHMYNCTLEEFRTYWSIPDDTLVICFDGKDPGPAVVFAAFAAHIDLAAAVGGRIRDHFRSEIVDDRDPHSIAVASGKLFGFSIGGKELDASGF